MHRVMQGEQSSSLVSLLGGVPCRCASSVPLRVVGLLVVVVLLLITGAGPPV
jgi:hypothetical protein